MNDGSKNGRSPARHPDTRVVTAGRDPASYHGFVNPPVYHASTVLYPSAEDYVAHRARYQYGRRGTPTTEALELAVQELEGPQCTGVALLPSGLAAISAALLSIMQAGDHLLVTDSAYGPTRNFCNQILSRLGVTVTYYDPLIGAAISELMQPNTRAVFLESPGSLSFEMQDVAAIAAAAHAKGALVLMDNTWASPLYFRALDHGVDLSIQAGTKYIGGHSDVMLGTVSANGGDRGAAQDHASARAAGASVPTTSISACADCARSRCGSIAIGDRGLPSRAGWSSGRKCCGCCIRRWKAIPVTRCGSAISPGRRDCSAWCSSRCRRRRCYAFLDALELFGIGASWGGYESLAIPFDCTAVRTATRWSRAARRCAFISGSKPSRTLSPISNAASPRSPPPQAPRRVEGAQT